jgi:hypothetical protein
MRLSPSSVKTFLFLLDQYVKLHRPVFPAPDDFQLIGLESERLPERALTNNWLVKRLIVSPIEFSLSRKTPTVSLLHLNACVDWVFAKKAGTEGHADISTRDIKLEIQTFVNLLITSAARPFYLNRENRNAGSRKLHSDDIANALKLPINETATTR